MTHQTPPEHFKGKSISEHLKDARKKSTLIAKEVHGTQLPGHLFATLDNAKNTATAYLLIWAASVAFAFDPLLLFIVFGLGWTIWNTGRSALLGWARLENFHRVIEEERWEIQHHREQEKEELREMYANKGFSGKLLEEVVEILMCDDNRLLHVMLEEELGLTLEAYEHPLKQAAGAALGTFLTSTFAVLAFYFWPLFGIPLIAFLTITSASKLSAKYEKRKPINSIIWNFALALFAGAVVYFLAKILV
ncbi:MAG: hypothetical protein KR126chlam3_00602 [Chlamydiae bacterium]|nr:hypothetical protein [Chlamydiota bacterium]